MPSLNLALQEQEYCAYSVSSLPANWNQSNYDEIVITDGFTSSGSTTPPGGTWYAEDTPPVSGTSRTTAGFVTGLTAETTYTLRAYALKTDGTWLYCGVDTIKTLPYNIPDPPVYDHMSLYGNNGARIYFTKMQGSQYTEFYWNISGTDPDYWTSYDARTTSTTNIIMLDLPYDSTVYFWIRSKFSDGSMSQWSYCDWLDMLSPPVPSAPLIDSRFDGGVNISCGAVSLATDYEFNYRKTGTTEWTIQWETTNTATITGLEYGTSYDFRARTNLNETYSSVNSGTTLPKSPTISEQSETSTSITIQVGALPDNCDKVQVDCYTLASTWVASNVINPGGRTFPTAQNTTFTGLDRDFTYQFEAYAYYDAGGDGTGTGTWLQSEISNVITVTTLNRPDDWAWSYAISSGGNIYNTSYASGKFIAKVFTLTEWEAFKVRINEFRNYQALSNYTFTTVNSTTEYTPAQFKTYVNECITAINDMGFTIPAVGSELFAQTFIDMKNALNSIA